MMASKAALMKDWGARDLILSTSDPKKQKALGRAVKNYDEKLWNERKFPIVYLANFYKFTQHENLKRLLLSTGNTLLVEASPFDTIWGIGLNETDAKNTDPALWPGKNYLGKVLTLVREDIKANFDNKSMDINGRFQQLGWL